MTDPTKWEPISYDDIKEGDRLKVITTADTANLRAKTVTHATVSHLVRNAWYCDNIRVISDPEDKDSIFTVEIYRRKPKPFVFPEGFGAMIEGCRKSDAGPHVINKCTSAEFQQFVRCQEGMWRNSKGNGFPEEEILDSFDHLVVLREGVRCLRKN